MSIYCCFRKKIENFSINVDFEGENEVLSLLGASGSGKSMILRCIAGVETPDSGTIIVDDKVLFDSERKINIPVSQRKTGMLFQDFALFPSMTVKENLEIVAKSNKIEKEKVDHLLKSYDLLAQQNQYPQQLSGGEKQRCAIARILLTSPEIILLDEPFSALDSFLRRKLEEELFSCLKKYKKTVIFVSHNREEVYRKSQKISVISNGKTSAMTDKKELFQNPQTLEAAILIGCENIISLEDTPSFTTFLQQGSKEFKNFNDKKSSHVCFFSENFVFHAEGERVDSLTVQTSLIFSDFQVVDMTEGVFSSHYTIKLDEIDSFFVVNLHKSVDLCNNKGFLSLKLEHVHFLTNNSNQ